MKAIKYIIIVLLTAISTPLIAQTNNNLLIKKEAGKARIVVVQGREHFVLVTGRKATGYNSNIEITLDAKIWETFESVLSESGGSSATIKDIDGYNVGVAKANVNGNTGLMFTSGSKCVAIPKTDFEKLHN